MESWLALQQARCYRGGLQEPFASFRTPNLACTRMPPWQVRAARFVRTLCPCVAPLTRFFELSMFVSQSSPGGATVVWEFGWDPVNMRRGEIKMVVRVRVMRSFQKPRRDSTQKSLGKMRISFDIPVDPYLEIKPKKCIVPYGHHQNQIEQHSNRWK